MTYKIDPKDPMAGINEDAALDRPAMSASQWEDGITSAVKALGEDMDLGVVFAGSQACTNGDMVILPSNDHGKQMTKRQVNVGRGFSYHETLHKLLTDFKKASTELARFKSEGRMLTERMCQAVEDVRIEHGGSVLFPGMPNHLDETSAYAAKHYLENGYKKDPSVAESFGRVGPIALTWAGRKRLGYSNPIIERALDTLSDEVRSTVEKWADMVMGLETGAKGVGRINKTGAYRGCMDGVRLAEMLANEAMQKDEEQNKQQQQNEEQNNGPQPQSQQQEGNSSSQETTNNSNGGGEGSGEGKEQSPDEGSGSQGGGEGNEGSQEGQSQGQEGGQQGGEEGSASGEGGGEERTGGQSSGVAGQSGKHDPNLISEPEPLDPELTDVVGSLLSEDLGKGPSDTRYKVFSRSEDFVLGDKDKHYDLDGRLIEMPEEVKHPDNAKHYADVLTTNSSQLGVMRRKLERALSSKQRVEYEEGRRRGKLSRRGVSQILEGKRNIFRQKVETDAVNTAVMLLVDCSSSMSHRVVAASMRRIEIAQQAAIAMAEALEPTQVEYEVTGFRSGGISDKLRDMRNTDPAFQESMYDLYGATHLYVFKDYDKSLRRCRHTMGGIGRASGGLTPDGPALLMAWERLKRRPEDRKVMLVMTDGRSEWWSQTDREEHFTRDAIQYCIDDGAEMVGIGIGMDTVSQLYPRYSVINHIEDLSKGVIDEVAKMLLGDNFIVDNSRLLEVSGRSVRRSVA